MFAGGFLKQYLKDEVEAFYAVAENNKDLSFNSSEAQLIYLSASEGAGIELTSC